MRTFVAYVYRKVLAKARRKCCLVLFYTSKVICKGRLPMEEIIFSLKHYWRFVDGEALELKALSRGWTRMLYEHKPNL